MPLEPLALMLLVVLGCAAFFFCAIYAMIRMAMAVLGGAAQLLRPRAKLPGQAAGERRERVRICSRPQCRRVEHRRAQFCSQCGAPLE